MKIGSDGKDELTHKMIVVAGEYFAVPLDANYVIVDAGGSVYSSVKEPYLDGGFITEWWASRGNGLVNIGRIEMQKYYNWKDMIWRV